MRARLQRDVPGVLIALAVLSSAGHARAAAEEFKPTPEQLADYHAVYTNGDVKHLRTVFDRATGRKNDRETRLLLGFEPYLARKFIVMSRDGVLAGGSSIKILFQGKPDALFDAWVYDRGRPGGDRYELRGFKRLQVPQKDLADIAARYRRFLEDAEHAM